MTWDIPWQHEFRYPDQGWTPDKCAADEAVHHHDDAPAAEGWRIWYFRHGRPEEGDGPGVLPEGPIVDFHTHAWVDSFTPRIREFFSTFGATPFDPGTLDGVRERKRALGVTKSVILPVPTKPKQVPLFNEWLKDYVNDPDIVPFMGLHPDMDDPVAEIHRCAALGFKGIKFHPINQTFRMADPRMFPIYEAAIEENLVMLFHTGPGMDFGPTGPTWDCSAAEIDRYFNKFPYERTVLAHLGGSTGYFLDPPELHPEWPGYMDVSFSLGRIADEAVLHIAREFGTNRILFGTDSPWEWTADFLTRMAHIGFADDELRTILYDNAARLLDLPSREQLAESQS